MPVSPDFGTATITLVKHVPDERQRAIKTICSTAYALPVDERADVARLILEILGLDPREVRPIPAEPQTSEVSDE